MFIEYSIAMLFGICLGTFTGLAPGIHVNLVAVVLVSMAPLLSSWLSPVSVALIIIATAVTHTFLDAIPSTFLGAPSPERVASVLPAHRLLHEGHGYEGVRLSTVGAFCSLVLSLLLFPLLYWLVPLLYGAIKATIGWLILAVVLYLIWREEDANSRFWAALLFCFSGVLGLIVLDLPLDQPLLPLLSGLFGIGSLLMALFEEVYLPPQTDAQVISVEPRDTLRCTLAATFSGWLASMLPGLGSAQAAILSTALFKDLTSELYLIITGGINTVNFVLSLVTLATLQKARNGAIVSVLELLPEVDLPTTLLFCIVVFIAGGVSTWLTFFFSRRAIDLVELVPYRLICFSVLVFVVGLVGYLTGFLGMLVLIVSTALGILPPLLGCARLHLMGCLLIPVMGFFLL